MTGKQQEELTKQLAKVSKALRDIRECLDPMADLAEALLRNIDKIMEGTNEE